MARRNATEFLTELDPNSGRVRLERTPEGDGSIEPAKKNVRLVGVEGSFFQLLEPIVAPLEHDPFQPVGGDADKALAFLTLAVGEIIGHAPDDVFPLLIEIPFGLEDGSPDQRVEPAPDLGNATLEIERAEFDAELLHQQLAKVGFHLVVPRARGKVAQQRAGARIVAQ